MFARPHRNRRLCPHWNSALHLPRWQRPFSKRGIKHTSAILGGLFIGLVGSTLATRHVSWVPDGIWHGFAYLLHAFGCIPVLQHAEPLWALLTEAAA